MFLGWFCGKNNVKPLKKAVELAGDSLERLLLKGKKNKNTYIM
jgi:hypothetical protein